MPKEEELKKESKNQHGKSLYKRNYELLLGFIELQNQYISKLVLITDKKKVTRFKHSIETLKTKLAEKKKELLLLNSESAIEEKQ